MLQLLIHSVLNGHSLHYLEPGGNADNAERRRRRRINDYVGLEHLNIPMVDSRVDKNGRNHCGIIVVTDHLSEWEVIIVTCHFEGVTLYVVMILA